MSAVATALAINLPGLFGTDGRYYEFSRPLRLEIEEDAEGNWHHSIPELELWAFEPLRSDSYRGFIEYFEAWYAAYTMDDDAVLGEGAREFKQRLLGLIKIL